MVILPSNSKNHYVLTLIVNNKLFAIQKSLNNLSFNNVKFKSEIIYYKYKKILILLKKTNNKINYLLLKYFKNIYFIFNTKFC